MINRNYYTMTLSILGVLKLVLDAFGMKLITNQNTNEIANAVATLLTFFGVIMTHIKSHPHVSFKQYVANFVAKFKKKPADISVEAQKIVQQATPVVKEVTPIVKTVESTLKEVKDPADIPVAVENVVKEVTPIANQVETLVETQSIASTEQPATAPVQPIVTPTETTNTTVQK